MKKLLNSIIIPACLALIFSCSTGDKYKLTIQGTDGTGTYRQGKEVPLVLENDPEGKEFLKWSGGGGFVHDVYSPETSVLIPGRDITIKAEFRDKKSCGVADLDRIRQDVQSSATVESNARSRHAALSRWWRLLWRQGYDMSAFDETARILVSTREYTPEAIRVIDKGFSILEDLFANPVYITEVAGTADEEKPDDSGVEENEATDWPYYHGIDGAQTGYSPDEGPSEGKLAWRFPKPYRSTAKPILSEGRVIISSPGIDVIGYCLDEESGEVIWNARQFGTNFYGTSKVRVSPLMANDRVIYRAGGRMHMFDKATGERIQAGKPGMENSPSGELILAWYHGNSFALYDVGKGEYTRGLDTKAGLAGEPLVHEGFVFAVCLNGSVQAFQAENGEILWEQELGTELRGEPAVYSGKLYTGSREGELFALDITDGKVLWSYKAEEETEGAYIYYSAPAESGNRLYIGGAGSAVYCLDAGEGDLLWKHSVSDWVRSKPLVIGDMVYVATMDGNLYALRDNGSKAEELLQTKVNEHGFAADLEGSDKGILAAGRDLILYSIFPETFYLNWKHGILDGTWIDGEFYRAGWTGGLQPSPTIVDGILYCGGMDGFVHALDAASGEEIWRFEGGGTCGAAITIAENKVFFGYISGNGDYYALDKNTGKLIWQSEEYGNVWVGAQYNSGKLFFGNMDGMMYGVDAESGEKLWTYDTSKDTPKENWRNMNKRGHGWPPGIYPVPVSDATKVYIGSWSGYYFAWDQETGELVWRTQTNNGNLEGGLPDSAAPVLWGDHVYVQKVGHILAALNRETGKIDWEWRAPMGFLQNGTVAAHDDKIFASYVHAVTVIPYNSSVIAFDDVEHGSGELWTYKGGAGLTAPVICDGKLITGSSADPFIVCLDPDTGSVIWRMFSGGEMLENVPAIYGNMVYAHFNTGWLYAIK